VNRAIADELVRLGIRKEGVVTIPNGVDPRRFADGDGGRFRARFGLGDAPVVLTPGRVCDVKNQRVAVDVVPRLSALGVDVRWVILGAPSEPAYFDSLKEALGRPELSSRILLVPGFPPESRELADAYASADLVVVPSKHEAFGLVVLEAWCAGKAVVATRVGGLPELVEDGVTGRLVPPGDVSGLADAIAGLLGDAGERSRLGEAGSARASDFEWGNVGSRTVSVYDRIARSA
jgi:glycosyltransferase involved in cell wall biosynthesis